MNTTSFMRNNRDRNQQVTYNNFNRKRSDEPLQVKVKPENFTLLDFPELAPSIKSGDNDNELMDFASVTKKERILETVDDPYALKPGWTSITMNNITGGSIKKTHVIPVKHNTESYHSMVTRGIQKMINRWEQYKTDYIDLYGEDMYEKMYLIPNYESVDDYDELEDPDDDDYYDYDYDYDYDYNE